MEGRSPRGRRRTLASVVAESLSRRSEARRPAAAAAFAEACGWPLSRELTVRGLGPDGHLWVVASSTEWARQAEGISAAIVARVNERLGRPVVVALDVRVRQDRKG
jgi:predicted NAD/FAD-dependent oxidoreductase